MSQTIRRNLVLKEYDIKSDPQGRQVVFRIKFLKKGGEIVYLPRAVACGLPFSMKDNRMRGVIAVDKSGDKIGHPYPVSIDLILEWNDKNVVL